MFQNLSLKSNWNSILFTSLFHLSCLAIDNFPIVNQPLESNKQQISPQRPRRNEMPISNISFNKNVVIEVADDQKAAAVFYAEEDNNQQQQQQQQGLFGLHPMLSLMSPLELRTGATIARPSKTTSQPRSLKTTKQPFMAETKSPNPSLYTQSLFYEDSPTPNKPTVIPQYSASPQTMTSSPPGLMRPTAVPAVQQQQPQMMVYGPPTLTQSYRMMPGRGMHHLLRKIFSTYDKEVMPARPVVIHMDVLLLKVKSTVEKEGIFESVIALFVEWNDSRMSWRPEDYDGNVTILAFDSDKVWLPDIAMTNSADHLYSISRDSRFVVRVTYDGNFKFVPTGTARTWCELKLPTFPFDVQTCSLEFESWALDSKTMTFDGQSHLLIDDTFASQQWSLCSYKTVTYDHLYEFTGETFTRVRFDFTVKRKSMFYVLILIFPSTLLSLIQLLVFVIPSDDTTADRIGFGTTNLLTLVVFQTIVTEEMPKSSDAVTSLSKYIIALIIIAAVGIFESVAVERLLRISAYPPPKVAVRFMNFFSKLWKAYKRRMGWSNIDVDADMLSEMRADDPPPRSPSQTIKKATTISSLTKASSNFRFFPCFSGRSVVVDRNITTKLTESPANTSTGGMYSKNLPKQYGSAGFNNHYQRFSAKFGSSNEDAIIKALEKPPPSYDDYLSDEDGPGEYSRRNSYFSALARGPSTSFIVNLMKNKKVEPIKSQTMAVPDSTSPKDQFSIERSKSEQHSSGRSTLASLIAKSPDRNFFRSSNQRKLQHTSSESFSDLETEKPVKPHKNSNSIHNPRRRSSPQLKNTFLLSKLEHRDLAALQKLHEANMELWSQLARYLDIITFCFCGVLAVSIPFVLFVPLVYFDDRCLSGENEAHMAHGSVFSNVTA